MTRWETGRVTQLSTADSRRPSLPRSLKGWKPHGLVQVAVTCCSPMRDPKEKLLAGPRPPHRSSSCNKYDIQGRLVTQQPTPGYERREGVRDDWRHLSARLRREHFCRGASRPHVEAWQPSGAPVQGGGAGRQNPGPRQGNVSEKFSHHSRRWWPDPTGIL